MAGTEVIVLGEGVFSVGGADIALTRGGGQFTVEREYRQMNADGDRGPVKGRTRVTGSVAKLQMSALKIIVDDLPNLYPATRVTEQGGTHTFEGKPDIEAADYNAVTWTGRTANGKEVVITLRDAINLENLSWTMAEKDEVVPQLTFTATYTEADRLGDNGEPWDVVFAPGGGNNIPPNPPTITGTTETDDQVEVAWDDPGYTGTSAIAGYQVIIYEDGIELVRENAESSPHAIEGLDASTEYTATVRARNDSGWGRESMPKAFKTASI